MSQRKRVLLLEFNELCPELIDRFIGQGALPNFAKLRSGSVVYETDAEACGEDLNPWVQWVTVHTGLAHEEHRIHHLSDGHRLAAKAIWDFASDAGLRVWVCGSMNPRMDRPLNGYLLPDPWSAGVAPYPPGEFDTFYCYVRDAVQEHTNPTAGTSPGTRAFLRYLASHGLTPSTALAAATQLFSERLGPVRWKRAAIMDRFQWDLFRHYYRRARPDLATFFINSTAHFQHCYWRHMQPEAFKSRPSERDMRTYKDAVLYGYREMDRLIGAALGLAGGETTVILATGLSQEPYLDYEDCGERHYYRLLDKSLLGTRLGVPAPESFEPLMADQFFLRYADEEGAMRAAERLNSLRLDETAPFQNGRPILFNLRREDSSVIAQCRCTGVVSPKARIIDQNDATVASFRDVFYMVDTTKSGRHNPRGVLWISDPGEAPRVVPEPVSLRSVAPTILDLLGVGIPAQMTAPSLTHSGYSAATVAATFSGASL